MSKSTSSRGLGFWMCLALVIGNMIGSGVFLLPASLAPYGLNSILGWLVTAAGSILLAFIFARLARSYPDAAGPYVYPLKAFNWPAEGLAQGTTEQEFDVRYTAYPFNPLETGTLAVNRDGFGEISEAPTGFMCIKRHVFDKMRAAYPERQCAPDRGDDPSIHGLYWTFFEDLIEPKTRRLLTEDYAFCHLWRKIGGKVFIDIDSKFSHQGQHVWQGDLAKHLETKRVR